VIYVMGAGRSGSTILGVALGNCENTFYAGELEAWLRRSGIPNFSGASRTRFWDAVRKEVDGEDLYGDTAWRYLEYSLALLRPSGWLKGRRLRPRYRQVASSLYRTLAARAEATHIVDTSHYPLRARELMHVGDIDLYLIYLVRNPRDVAASFGRRDVTNRHKSFLATNAYLFLTQLLSTYVFLRHRADRRLFIRYEDLIERPEATVAHILNWAGQPAPPPRLRSLQTGMPFQGNRLLQADSITLNPQTSGVRADGVLVRLTAMLQSLWSPILSRLGPRTSGSADIARSTRTTWRRRARDRLAQSIGLSVHCMAARLRRRTSPKASELANIAVLCVGFLRYGSAQAIGLRKTGLNVTLYYVDRRAEFAESHEDRAQIREHARAAGVEIVKVPRRRIRSLLGDTIRLHRDLRRRGISAAVVQSHIDPRYATVGLALPTALMLHDPKPHTGDTLASFPAPVRAIARFSELTSSCLLIHSERLHEQIRPLMRGLPVGVVPHGADIASSPLPVPGKRSVLVFGRLFAYKGVDTALQAMRLLPAEMADVTLIVAGRGPLAELARDLPNVELRDEYISDAEAQTLLRETRLVLLPYKDATQSGVGLQAVACGIPCVVSSVGGLPDLIPQSASSLIVAPDDPHGLADAIVAHIDHGDALRRSIYDHAKAHYAWPVAAQRLRSEWFRLRPSESATGDNA
jgi:glycosyltransferase involved in cell wall biosynthesis